MEICYYWIDSFNDFIKRQGFNFGGELFFEYNEDSKKLSVRENKSYIKNFFHVGENKKISNVTAVIGKNGGGKTTFLSALKGLFIDGGILSIKHEDGRLEDYQRILVMKVEDEYRVIFHKDLILEKETGGFNIEFENNIETHYKFEIINYGTEDKIHKLRRDNIYRVKGTEIIDKTSSIYFSNIFDNNFYDDISRVDRKYFDISTRGLLNKIETAKNEVDGISFYSGGTVGNHIQTKDTRFNIGALKDYLIDQLKNKLITLRDEQCRIKILEQFTLPNKLYLNMDHILYRNEQPNFFNANDKNILRYEKDQSNINKVERFIYNYINSFSTIFDTSKNTIESVLAKQTYLKRMIDAYFDDVDRYIFFMSDVESIKSEIEKLEDKDLINKNIFELLEIYKDKVINLLQKLNSSKSEQKREFNEKEFEKLTQSYMDFIKFFSNHFIDNSILSFIKGDMHSLSQSQGTTSFGFEDICLVEIPLNSAGIELANQFIDEYKKIYTTSDFIKFQWRGISSGEDALFTMYSRFYSLKNIATTENIVIFLDEGELYLHPEWQRKYLDMILNYLSYIFSQCDSIQLIIASNAPFLIADVPKQNIIFLDRYSDDGEPDLRGKCKVINIEDVEQTFASNIHNLLMNSFFMESTIGAFSDRKIKEVIKFLKEDCDTAKEENQREVQKVWRIINTIGEPILKRKLTVMFNEKYKEIEQRLRYDQIEELKREIERLRKLIDNSNLMDIDNVIELLKEKIELLKKKAENND